MNLTELIFQKISSHFALFLVTISLIFFFALFFWLWLREPRRLLNGNILTISLAILAFWLSIIIYEYGPLWLRLLWYDALLAGILIILLISSVSWLLLLWNSYFVLKHESHTLPNLLTLFLGLGFVAFWLYGVFTRWLHVPVYLIPIIGIAPTIAFYLLIVMYSFLINLFLYQFVPKKYHEDYLIVLGAGLINGETVTPLLAKRIDRAITYAQKQAAKTGNFPKIIMSGGQGSDEKISEAKAMENYALTFAIPREMILLEDKSKNTYENMLFSKKLAEDNFGSKNFKAKFFTNNYHLLRAGILAKQAGLDANGVGAKTRFYYLPTATLREFAGICILHKKRHLAVILLIILFSLLNAFLSYVNIR